MRSTRPAQKSRKDPASISIASQPSLVLHRQGAHNGMSKSTIQLANNKQVGAYLYCNKVVTA